MDSPIISNWMCPLSFLGVLGVIFNFLFDFFAEISLCKQNSPRWDAAFCGVPSVAMLFAYVSQKDHQVYMSQMNLYLLQFYANVTLKSILKYNVK